MNYFQSVLRTALSSLALGLTAACSAGGVSIPKPTPDSAVAADGMPGAAQTPSESGAALMAQLQQLIGQAPCTSDVQCRSLPVGARACGGPDQHLAWSTQATDAVALQRAADSYTQWQTQAHKRSGMAGICVVEVDPGAYCKKPGNIPGKQPAAGPGQCSLRTGAAPSPLVR